jgi:gamma-glutamylcyclotransferase (GGCT)/AIG2-like uncharacterized protein YtfP
VSPSSESASDFPTAVFVYGTLQRGQCREKCWPLPPRDVTPATTQGRLFDLGEYPALAVGKDVVGGECWRFAPEELDATLEALDEVEGYCDGPDDLYTRRIVRCRLSGGDVIDAWAYFLADVTQLATLRPLRADDDGVVRWRPST